MIKHAILSFLIFFFCSPVNANSEEIESQEGPNEENTKTKENNIEKYFDIFGLNTKSIYKGNYSIGGKDCKIVGKGNETCIRNIGAVIGNSQIEALISIFDDGYLSTISGASQIKNFKDISSSFENKYGSPDKVENTQWQNRLGNKLDNIHMTWVFSDGILILKARDFRADYSTFTFVSKNQLDKPKVESPINF